MKIVLFTDECHKIYYASANDRDTIMKMETLGYDTIVGSVEILQDMWENSCPLRFIQHANFNSDAPQVYQGDEREDVAPFFREILDYFA